MDRKLQNTLSYRKLLAVFLFLFLFSMISLSTVNAGCYFYGTKICNSGDNKIHGSEYLNGSLWFSTATNPARILKMNATTLDYQKVTLTSGLYSGYDVEYAEDYIWVTLRMGDTKLVKVTPSNLSWEIALTMDSPTLAFGASLVYAFDYLWVGGKSKMARVNLTDMSYSVFDYTATIGLNFVHALASGNGYVWATTMATGYVLRIDPSDPTTYTSSYTCGYYLADDMDFMDGYLYVGTESEPSRLYKINGDNVSDYTYKQIGDSKCYSVTSYGNYIWAAYIGTPGVVRQISQSLIVVDSFSLPSGYNDANEIVFDDSGIAYITCWMSPARVVKYQTGVEGNYVLYGAYNEVGARDGTINVTAYHVGGGSQTFELDGSHTLYTQPVVLEFSLGYNQSRTYYIKDDAEEIYVFKPYEPYDIYYFSISDFIGITNGYLETLINVNGTQRVVERWSLNILNDLPFTLSWARIYQIRLVCDQGTHVFGSYMAKETKYFNLIVVQGMFPTTYPGLDLSVKAKRMNSTWIQTNYTDNDEETSWLQIQIKYKSGHSWVTAYTSSNYTVFPVQDNWYLAVSTTDYVTYVTASRDEESKTWSFSCPHVAEGTNPWDDLLDGLGDWPIPAENVIGLFLVLAVLAVSSYWSMPLGCILATIMAGFLTYIRWLNIGWDLIALAFSVGILAYIAVAKKEEREI